MLWHNAKGPQSQALRGAWCPATGRSPVGFFGGHQQGDPTGRWRG